jgi:hypothetical protein
MGHHVTGLIAAEGLLQRFAARHGLHPPVSLPQDLAILPLTDEDIDRFVPASRSGHVAGFTYLSQPFATVMRETSADGRIMYFETDYFGGMGAQGAVVYDQGVCIFGPESGELGPINRALSLLGVKAAPFARDEFEAIGLHRHRSPESWLED